MLNLETKTQIRVALERTAVAQAEANFRTEEVIGLIVEALGLNVAEARENANIDRPIVDSRSFSIIWRERSCFLGNTLLFRLFERLAQSQDRYVAHVDLLDDVWQGDRRGSTIRGVV